MSSSSSRCKTCSHSYLEWGSRLAVINAQPGADVTIEASMPRWAWGEAKGPYIPPDSQG